MHLSTCFVSLFIILSTFSNIFHLLKPHFNIVSGACVRLAEEQDVSIDTLTLQQLQEIDARFEEDVLKVWNYEESVERKSSIGGTAKSRVLEQIDQCVAFAQLLSNA